MYIVNIVISYGIFCFQRISLYTIFIRRKLANNCNRFTLGQVFSSRSVFQEPEAVRNHKSRIKCIADASSVNRTMHF